ncbi:hypothetical protein M0812_21417 [Anaeramoeba flamelloides]|uniref:Uncharacterized protein n=1 Tax=Anaeramoeba flamelloides TaxID=1746091 RepID=A0AAV7YUY4_9EUKA|nr:hypothetical protein M0812_21417 [Anaeramoeba flamelloides]
MNTLFKTSKKTLTKDGKTNPKKTGNQVIGPFHYSELTLSSLCEIIGSKSRTCYDFLFFIPEYCLTFENEHVKNRWVWNWDKYYSSNSDLVAFLIHSSTYIPNKTAQSPTGLLVTIRFIDVSPPSFAMKRKNGIRSRYSSKLKGSCFFAKSIEIINDQEKVPTKYFSVPQLKEFMNLNCSIRKRKFVTLNSQDFLKNANPIFEHNNVLNSNDQKKKRKKVNRKNLKIQTQPKQFKIKISKHQLEQEQEKEKEHEQIKKKRNNKKKSLDHHKKNSKKLYSHDSNRNRSPKRKKKKKKRNSSFFRLMKRKTNERGLKRSPKIIYKYSPQTSSVSGSENNLDSQRQISEESDSETFAVINANTDFDRKATLRNKNNTDQNSGSNNESDYKSESNSEPHLSSQTNSSFGTNSETDSVSETKSNSERENKKKFKKKKKTKSRKRKKKRQFRKSKHKKRSKQRRKKKYRKNEKRKMKTKHKSTSKNKNYKTRQSKRKKKTHQQNQKSQNLQLTNSVSLPNLVVSPLNKQNSKLKRSNQSQNFCNSEPENKQIKELQNGFLSFLKYPNQNPNHNENLNKEQLENLALKKQIFFSIWKKCGSEQFLQTDFHSNNEQLLGDSLLTELSFTNNKTGTSAYTNTNTNENSFSSQSVLFSLSNEPCLSYSKNYLCDFGFQNKDQTYYKFRSQVLYLETAEKRYELSFEQNGLFRLAQILNPENFHFNSLNIPMDHQKIKIIKQNLFWGQIKWSANFILIGDFMIEPMKFFWCEKKQAQLINHKEN